MAMVASLGLSTFENTAGMRTTRRRGQALGLNLLRHRAVLRRSGGDGAGEEHMPLPPVLNEQFMGVLQQSLARQGADALTRGPSAPEEPRASAVEEVLTNALNQSKHTLQMLQRWRLQIDAQIAAQEKQVERMEFALHKAHTDAAYMKALKSLAFTDE